MPFLAVLVLVEVLLRHLARLPAPVAAVYPVVDLLVLRQRHFVGDVNILDDLSKGLPSCLEDVDVPVVVGWKPNLGNIVGNSEIRTLVVTKHPRETYPVPSIAILRAACKRCFCV